MTNLDRPVFALVNLPEVVKGALFARYSRSNKSLRRLFLDEFVGDLDISGDAHRRRDRRPAASRGALRPRVLRVRRRLGRAARRRAPRVRAGIEPAHEGPRVGPADRVYLEQSTRYIAYDARLGGRYRYYRDPAVLGSSLGTRYVGDVDRLFDTYGAARHLDDRVVPRTSTRRIRTTPTSSTARRSRPRRSTPLGACSPRPTISNVGIYGTGQAFETMLLRMRAHPLPEARAYAELMLEELRKVIPSFLKRVDRRRPRGRVGHLPRADPGGDRAAGRRAARGRRSRNPCRR